MPIILVSNGFRESKPSYGSFVDVPSNSRPLITSVVADVPETAATPALIFVTEITLPAGVGPAGITSVGEAIDPVALTIRVLAASPGRLSVTTLPTRSDTLLPEVVLPAAGRSVPLTLT